MPTPPAQTRACAHGRPDDRFHILGARQLTIGLPRSQSSGPSPRRSRSRSPRSELPHCRHVSRPTPAACIGCAPFHGRSRELRYRRRARSAADRFTSRQRAPAPRRCPQRRPDWRGPSALVLSPRAVTHAAPATRGTTRRGARAGATALARLGVPLVRGFRAGSRRAGVPIVPTLVG